MEDNLEVERGQTLLSDIRASLLKLHKTLLEWERSGYERIHGRQSSGEILDALLNDPQFAWLRPMSQLIVRIDELLAQDTPPMRNDVDAVVSQTRIVTSADESGTVYQQRYHYALQEYPDAVFAHRDVVKLLK